MKIKSMRLYLDVHDVWVGCYWRPDGWGVMRRLTLYFCIVPCVPLRVELEWVARRSQRRFWGLEL